MSLHHDIRSFEILYILRDKYCSDRLHVHTHYGLNLSRAPFITSYLICAHKDITSCQRRHLQLSQHQYEYITDTIFNQ